MSAEPEMSLSPVVFSSSAEEKPTYQIRPATAWPSLRLREIWAYRDLLWILVQRDIKIVYKQTALGAVWIILQPLIAALLFAAVFGRVARLPSDGAPYLLFVFSGLTVWTYFSQALQRAGNSLVRHAQLVSKTYFPRVLIPLAHTTAAMLDFGITLVVLLILTALFHFPFTPRLLAIPLLFPFMDLLATGVALWFSALGVKYRDCGNVLPYFVQIWMYASPVVYPMSMLPPHWRTWFVFNPMVGLIEGVRWAVLGTPGVEPIALVMTVGLSLLAFFTGMAFFSRAEQEFADII